MIDDPYDLRSKFVDAGLVINDGIYCPLCGGRTHTICMEGMSLIECIDCGYVFEDLYS